MLMNFGPILCLLFTAVWSVAMCSGNDALVSMLLVNAGLQVALFVLVACIPYVRTGRMSYVDIAWPFGVALVGVLILSMGDGNLIRRMAAGSIYLLIGLRMGLGALALGIRTGVIFRVEFPRYTYRRMIMEKAGNPRIRFHTLSEIMAQGLANASVLALPGFLLAVNPDGSLSGWEVAGIAIWLIAYVLESTADAEKLLFVSRNKGGVCDVGLWRYSRHPNYFAEWLVWTGLVTAAVPSWLYLVSSERLVVVAVLGFGAVGASGMMYVTLVYLTGAVPAEYYSLRHRPGYEGYQRRTNMFFPWFPKADRGE